MRSFPFSTAIGFPLFLGGVILTSRSSFLLFHCLAEFLSIIIAWCFFVLAWHTRRYVKDDYLLILGIAAFFAGGIDLVHTLAYKGMNVFAGYDANLPTQLWIAARYLQSLSLLFVAARMLVPSELRHPLDPCHVLVLYAAITALLLGTIFGSVFPTCYIEGLGLTSFKKASEIVISLILLVSTLILWRVRERYDRSFMHLLLGSTLMMIGTELAFTAYISVYGFSNLLGHVGKITAFYLLYRAVILTGLERPYALLFRELKESEERFRLFMKHLPGVAFMKDASGRYLYLNDRFKEVFKVSLADWQGKTDQELGFFPKEVIEHVVTNDRKVLAERASLEAVEKIPVDGEMRHWLTVKFPLATQEASPGLLAGIAIDVTERHRAQEEKLRLERRLQQAKKTESLARMAGAIAHHFNNQLAVVLGSLELGILTLPQEAQVRKYIADAMAASQRAADIGRLLLTYLGQTTGKREPVALSTVCREALTLLSAALPHRIHLEAGRPDPGPVVLADAVQIRLILTNLVLNATEAMDKREGDVSVAVCVIPTTDIRATRFHPLNWKPEDEAYACLSVSDTGSGMEAETLEKLFDPFFSTKFTGRGLGLAVVLGIVKAHEGGITVASAPGRGTIFRVFLPLTSQELALPLQADPVASVPAEDPRRVGNYRTGEQQ
jgi:PAS domain S-box-containing protein